MSKKLQKSISILTTTTTAVWLSGVAMLAPMTAMAVVDGDIVSPDAEFTEDGTTYYPYDVFIVKMVGDKTFKRLILNPEVFESYGHLEWGNIQTISADTVDGYTTSNLVREIDDTKVYKLTPDGDTGTKGWLNMTAADFESEGYDWDSIYIINATDRDNYTTGSDVTTDGAPVVSEGTLTVALAADTPASGTVVKSAARAPFTKINLTATGGDVVIDSMILERGGLAQDGAFAAIAVILDSVDGDQLGSNKTLGSTHQTTLNDDLTISNGTTRSIYLTGNMASALTAYAGETPTLGLAAITLKGSASLNVTLPIFGNYQTVNSTITISTATVVVGGNNPSTSTQKVGVTDYIVSSIKISNSSAEKITVKKIVFTQDGSADTSDVENLDLVNSNTGEVLETKKTVDGKTVAFVLDLTMDKGKNISFDLRLDIIDGSGRSISYEIDEQTDILVVGETYGYYITPTYTGVTARPYYDAPNTVIGDGTLSIESLSVSPTKIAEETDDIVLGKFKFVAKGEEVKITSIGWNILITRQSPHNASTTDVTNITIEDESGSSVAGPQDPIHDETSNTTTTGAATTTDTIIVPVGETTYTVIGDLSGDFNANDTIQARVDPSLVTARGMTTDNSITPTPSGWISSTNLTIKAAALAISVSSDPAAQTVVAGTQNFVFAKYLFDATDSGSDIKVTQIKTPLITTGNAYPDLVSDLELFDGDDEISVNTASEDANWGTTAAASATTTHTLTAGALTIPAGTSKLITTKADIGTGATSGTLKIGMQANGVTATDNEGNTVTENVTASQGQAMTLSEGGTLNLAALTDPKSALVVAGSSGVAVGKFTLQAKYEDITINYLGVTLAAPSGGVDATEADQLASIELYEDGVSGALGSITLTSANATITPSSTLTLPAGTTKNFTLKAIFNGLSDVSPAQSGAGIIFKLTSLDATGVSAGSSSITVAGLDGTFNQFNLFKSLPTVTKLAFSGADTITGNSVVSLYKFKVTADSAGPIGLTKFTFGISTTTVNLCNTATDITDTTGYYLYMSDSEGSLGDIVSRGSSTALADMVAGMSGSASSSAILETYFDVNDDDTSGTAQEQIIINSGDTKYFTLRGTIASGHDGNADNESISTVMAGDADWADTSLGNANVVDGKAQDDFIWTDLNADLYSSSTATQTSMYVNGYRVSGLDSTSSTPQTIGD